MQTKQGGDDDKRFRIQAWKTNIARHSEHLVAVTLVCVPSKSILWPFLTTILHETEHSGSSFTLYSTNSMLWPHNFQLAMRKMYFHIFPSLFFMLHVIIFRSWAWAVKFFTFRVTGYSYYGMQYLLSYQG